MISEAYHINCNDFLDETDLFFDLAIPDPPYFSGPETRGYYGAPKSSTKVKRISYDKIDTWDLPDTAWFERLKLKSETQIIFGANYFDFIGPVHPTPRRKQLNQWIKDHPTGWIVWDKCNGNTSFNDFELAWTNMDMPTVIYKFMWNGMCQGKSIFEGDIMQGNKKLNQRRIHPTEKPIPLYKWLLYQYAKPGFKILDTHLGSGASRIGAYEMGFDFYGCELNETNFNNQEKRFAKYLHKMDKLKTQTKLFS